MNRKVVLGIFVIILLFSISMYKPCTGCILYKPRIEITNIDPPDEVNPGETFNVNVIIKNNRFRPIFPKIREHLLPEKVTVQVVLLSEIPLLKGKIIGENTTCICRGGTSKTIHIECIINESDITLPLQNHKVQAMLYKDFPLLRVSRLLDCSDTKGIHVNSTYRFIENYKVKIDNVIVPQTLEENKNCFNATVNVTNEGAFDVSAWVQIDMIEKPSAIPEFEELVPLKGLASLRKELGKSSPEDITADGGNHSFEVNCSLRKFESKKDRFIIEAVLFVNIDGLERQVDSSKLYEIQHNQSFCLEQNWLLIVVLVFCGIVAVGIIAVVIRILYPLYYIKKNKLKEEKERLDKRKR